MSIVPRYFLWGILLGCGVATPILHSALLVLLGVQLTAGVGLGCASGVVFGVTRETVALLPLWRKQDQGDPEPLMQLLPALKGTVQRLNLVWIVVTSVLLLVVR